MNNQDAVRHLFLNGVINHKTFRTLIKRCEKLKAKQAKEVRQASVTGVVERHLESLEPGKLFKHRTVWEAVGRDEFTRDEVLTALQACKETGLVEQVRKGPNNFQIFWARVLNDEVEVEETAEEAS
jgi:hypothetical protein